MTPVSFNTLEASVNPDREGYLPIPCLRLQGSRKVTDCTPMTAGLSGKMRWRSLTEAYRQQALFLLILPLAFNSVIPNYGKKSGRAC